MSYTFRSLTRAASPCLSLVFVMLGFNALAVDQTQNLNLVEGWNSVWLSVEPQDADGNPQDIATVFQGNPEVTVVSTIFKPVGTADFFTNADGNPFNQEQWGVWRRNSELQENTLTTMPGQRGYLIRASSTVSVPVSGEVWFESPTWHSDSFNLVGFNLLGNPGDVTFDQLFASAGTRHPVNKIFKLDSNGNWVGVQGSETMTDQTAYLIYANGKSDFMGAVSVRPGRSLDFGAGPGTVTIPDPNGGNDLLVTRRELTFSNISDSQQTPRLSNVKTATTTDHLRLYSLKPAATGLEWTLDTGAGVQPQLGSRDIVIEASTNRTVSIGAHRGWTTLPELREELFRVELGTHYFWLPTSAKNASLSDATAVANAPSYVGLWIGDAVVNTVTSITEQTRPESPTTSNALVRVLLHVDSTGQASLLSHVMLMQTKTASTDVAPEPVLVVDESKIPFFEGIEMRQGKRVGRRFESTSYDMPRKTDATTQAATYASEASVSDPASFTTWLNAQTARSPDLVEAYHLQWPLTGGLGPNAIVRTPAGSPLLLDPFHRSNPFRHAFHPQHGAGRAVTREVEIAFDSVQQADVLQGRYDETLHGLTNTELRATGRIRLQRLSKVGDVQ